MCASAVQPPFSFETQGSLIIFPSGLIVRSDITLLFWKHAAVHDFYKVHSVCLCMCVSEQRIRCGMVFVWAIVEAFSVSQQTVQVEVRVQMPVMPHKGCLHVLSSQQEMSRVLKLKVEACSARTGAIKTLE